MYLDPRFKVMPFLSKAEKSDVHFAVNLELLDLITSTEGSEHSEQTDQQETAQQAAKKRKLSKFFHRNRWKWRTFTASNTWTDCQEGDSEVQCWRSWAVRQHETPPVVESKGRSEAWERTWRGGCWNPRWIVQFAKLVSNPSLQKVAVRQTSCILTYKTITLNGMARSRLTSLRDRGLKRGEWAIAWF